MSTIPVGMVTHRPVGRLGNFLFQAACDLAYGWDHDMPVSIPSTTNDTKWNPIYLQHLVSSEFNPALPVVRVREGKHFAHHELPFKDSWRRMNVVLDGYWQSEKYFLHHRQRILDAFGYPWEMNCGLVSVHVRRTDYLTLTKKHPPVTAEWYAAQMRKFPGAHFRFFSDDIQWCCATFGERRDCSFSCGQTEENDLIEISFCEHHICSASTFAWWGAWLNRNPAKRIIIPRQWFMPGHGGLDTKDIVPETWERE